MTKPLVKTRSVLNLSVDSGESVTFAHSDRTRTVTLSRADWTDLGEPGEITVTIEPGDKLNK